MNTASTAAQTKTAAPFSLAAIVSTIFSLEMRDQLAAASTADQADARYTYGL